VTPLLQTHELSSGHNGVAVTHGVSLAVEAGEVVALLGPNGAGKTSTLLTISGLLEPLGGSVELFGADTSTVRRSPHALVRQGLAHVPEDRSLFYDLTVRENLRVCAAATRTTIAEAVAYFPALEGLMSRKAALLSGGEQQMLALARGFAGRPKLLVVDELSLGLAPVVVERILPAVQAFARGAGTGVLLVEQHVDLALDAADRAYVMVDGSVVMEGPATELRKKRELLALSYLGERGLDPSRRESSPAASTTDGASAS
jgi:branched-chain amino acid transport system ATP-binding protein